MTPASSDDTRALRSLLRSPRARAAGFKERKYQLDCASGTAKLIKSGRSAALNLPTGIGKTLVGNLASALLLGEGQRAFYIVPRRILVDQHERFARWMQPALPVARIDDRVAAGPSTLEALCRQSAILVSTPMLAARLIRRGSIPSDVVRSVVFNVVDEFDAFLVFQYEEDGPIARFSDDFAEWWDTDTGRLPSLLMSATSPIDAAEHATESTELRLLAEHIESTFKPKRVVASERSLRRYKPTARIHGTTLSDGEVAVLAKLVRAEMTSRMDELEHTAGRPIDRDYVMQMTCP